MMSTSHVGKTAWSFGLTAICCLAVSACSSGGGTSLTPEAMGQGPLRDSVVPAGASAAPSLSSPAEGSAGTMMSGNPGNVAMFEGCRIFTAGDYYNADVTNAAVDPHSAAYIRNVLAGGNNPSSGDTTGFAAGTGYEVVNLANDSTQSYKINGAGTGRAAYLFPVPEPWSAAFYIEGPNEPQNGIINKPAGDAHSIVLRVTPPKCYLWEGWHTAFNGTKKNPIANAFFEQDGGEYDLTKPLPILPNGYSSSSTSGMSEFAGMVKFEELATGINHALNIDPWQNALCECFTKPASDTDQVPYQQRGVTKNVPYELPYGAHLRLHANFDDSSFGPQSKAIAEALKHYGGFITDTGGNYVNNNYFYTARPEPGTSGKWSAGDLSNLNKITFGDFDVLTVGPTTPCGPNCH